MRSSLGRHLAIPGLAVLVLGAGVGTVLLFPDIDLRSTLLAAPSADEVTFATDVAPILYDNCVPCHRPGQIGPMSLLDYETARSYAPLIRLKVKSREMPPWDANPGDVEFANERSLSDDEIRTIVAWADAGAPEGDPAALHPAPEFVDDEWLIGEPDVVFDMGEDFHLPADTDSAFWPAYVVPTNFAEGKYVVAAEVRPSDPSIVHHGVVSIVKPEGAEDFFEEGTGHPDETTNRLKGYIPGTQPMRMPPGVAKRIPAGSSLRFDMHYEPTGVAGADRTRVGLVFADGPIRKERRQFRVTDRSFEIPPFVPRKAVDAIWEVPYDIELDALRPHLHMRAVKTITTLIYSDGREKLLLDNDYDYRWQLSYHLAEPLFIPRGSWIHVVGYFDNSPNNRFNPDPSATVSYCARADCEMMGVQLKYTLAGEDLTEHTKHLAGGG